MKLFLILTFIFLMVGCIKQKLELGLNFYQLENVLAYEEATYMKELGGVFEEYDLILSQVYSIRNNNLYYFIERNHRSHTGSEYIEISDNLKKIIGGWLKKIIMENFIVMKIIMV